jgi:hypothetical protein
VQNKKERQNFAYFWFEGFETLKMKIMSRGNAVGKLTGYGTDDLGDEFLKGQEFSLHNIVQTGSGAYTDSYKMFTGVLSSGGEAARQRSRHLTSN